VRAGTGDDVLGSLRSICEAMQGLALVFPTLKVPFINSLNRVMQPGVMTMTTIGGGGGGGGGDSNLTSNAPPGPGVGGQNQQPANRSSGLQLEVQTMFEMLMGALNGVDDGAVMTN